MQNAQYTRTEGGEAGGVYPRFFMEAVQDPVASAQAGRPIFKEEERVEIVMPGNQLTIPVKRVSDVERQRWAREYDAFRKGVEDVPDGTPLKEWPCLNKAQVAELTHLGFRVVEDIPVAPDTVIQRIGMGGYGLREKAKAWLDDAASIALTESLSAENNQLRAEVANLQRQVTEQGELLRQVHAELIAKKNEGHPFLTQLTPDLTTVAPAEPPAASSLANLELKRRPPGRPRKIEEAVV